MHSCPKNIFAALKLTFGCSKCHSKTTQTNHITDVVVVVVVVVVAVVAVVVAVEVAVVVGIVGCPSLVLPNL